MNLTVFQCPLCGDVKLRVGSTGTAVWCDNRHNMYESGATPMMSVGEIALGDHV